MIQRLVSMFGVLDFIGMKVGVEVHQCLIMQKVHEMYPDKTYYLQRVVLRN
jgi:hypothetical protein